MEQTECSEMSAHKFQTPGNNPKKEYNIRFPFTKRLLHSSPTFSSIFVLPTVGPCIGTPVRDGRQRQTDEEFITNRLHFDSKVSLFVRDRQIFSFHYVPGAPLIGGKDFRVQHHTGH